MPTDQKRGLDGPFSGRMAAHRLVGADPHGDVVDEKLAIAEQDARASLYGGKACSDAARWLNDARTLAAYAVNLARGHDLGAFEAANLAAIALRYGCRGAREARPDETEVLPLLEELLAGADRRHADRVAASLWRSRSLATSTRPRPRLARLWAFLTGAAS